MSDKILKSKAAIASSDPAAIPEFDRAMRAIVRAPKSAVELSIQAERHQKTKKPNRRRK